MNIKDPIPMGNGWMKFTLNVGGFNIVGCRWNPQTRDITFPLQYNRAGRGKKLIRVPDVQVELVRTLLLSGRLEEPRDRTPCPLTIQSIQECGPGWYKFAFTVRGFTIDRCRWEPSGGSVQPPVSYFGVHREIMKRIVWASGPHINRLRKSLLIYARANGLFPNCLLIDYYGARKLFPDLSRGHSSQIELPAVASDVGLIDGQQLSNTDEPIRR
jgi:hypothetical protein